jgi:hypothetical protein
MYSLWFQPLSCASHFFHCPHSILQAVFWGHPVTVGDSLGSSIDYFISSPLFEEKKIQSNRPRSGSEQELEIEMEGDDQKQQQQWLRASHTEQVNISFTLIFA